MCAIKVKGFGSVKKLFGELERELPNEIKTELKGIAEGILADAVGKVHVLSGHLKASAFIEEESDGWLIGFSASYAAFEEFGTGSLVEVPTGYEDFALSFKVQGGRIRNGNPHPYLFPAFLKERENIVKRLANGINDYIKSK